MSKDTHAFPPCADIQNISCNLRERVIQDDSPQQGFSVLYIENRGKSVLLKSSVRENKGIQAGKTTFFLSLEVANSFTVRSATPTLKGS